MERAALTSSRIDSYFGCGLHSLPVNLWQSYQNVLSTIMRFYTASLLTYEVILQQMKCGNQAMLIEFTVFTVFPTSWSSWLNRMVEWSFETLLWSASVNALSSWSNVLQDVLNVQYMICFSYSQNLQIQELRGGNESDFSITPSDLTAKILLAISMVLGFFSLRDLVFKEKMASTRGTQWFHWMGSWNFHLVTLSSHACEPISKEVTSWGSWSRKLGGYCTEEMQECVWNRDPQQEFLCSVIKRNGKLPQLNLGRAFTSSNLSGIKLGLPHQTVNHDQLSC